MLSSRVQVAPPSIERRMPTPRVALPPVAVGGLAVAGAGEDDRLVGVVVAAEDGDAADVEAE